MKSVGLVAKLEAAALAAGRPARDDVASPDPRQEDTARTPARVRPAGDASAGPVARGGAADAPVFRVRPGLDAEGRAKARNAMRTRPVEQLAATLKRTEDAARAARSDRDRRSLSAGAELVRELLAANQAEGAPRARRTEKRVEQKWAFRVVLATGEALVEAARALWIATPETRAAIAAGRAAANDPRDLDAVLRAEKVFARETSSPPGAGAARGFRTALAAFRAAGDALETAARDAGGLNIARRSGLAALRRATASAVSWIPRAPGEQVLPLFAAAAVDPRRFVRRATGSALPVEAPAPAFDEAREREKQDHHTRKRRGKGSASAARAAAPAAKAPDAARRPAPGRHSTIDMKKRGR